MSYRLFAAFGGIVVASSGLLFEWLSWIQYVMLMYLVAIGWLAPRPFAGNDGYGGGVVSLVAAIAVLLFNLIGAVNPFEVFLRFIALYLVYISIFRIVSGGSGNYFLSWMMFGIALLSSLAAINLEEWQGTGRFSWGEIHPNLLAMYGYVLGICLVAVPQRTSLRILGGLLATGFILLYSSRAPLVAFAVFTALYYFLTVRAIKAGIFLLFASILVGSVAFEWIGNVLLLNDEYRGVDSGLSGRVDYWRSAIQVFHENPIVGVGYGQAERLLGIPVDNGYLLLLAEGGVIGAAAFLILIANFIRLALRQRNTDFGRISLALVFSFCVYIMFERRYLAIGNPLSILMMVAYAGLVMRENFRFGERRIYE